MKRETDNQKLAKERAKRSAEKLFGNRSKDQEKALKDVKSIGKPENLVKPEDEEE